MISEYVCPCCERFEFSEEGSYEICPVCDWEDDSIQNADPDYCGGANVMSLNEAKKAYSEGRKVQ
ncbi:CPCC family cysteine-rich protein [Erwinia billingiae]|jgi:anaerobic ribonucleoside-triphosphate reductase|uniref:CPCC family cysteine-rich protein n=1 Tax=Erwinia billingiae TaxID=182337 RepID=UPI000CFEBD83|nr:CPCC family cysteine-rich protein [Erwinia billingiae]PRB58084.1 hypothetical protein CQ001_16245 [Erwinia billingiae]